MALNFLISPENFATFHDQYSPPLGASSNGCRVCIECLGKRVRVNAMLSQGLKLSVSSKWESLFKTAIGGDIGLKALDIIDNVAQFAAGYSIRQPYFGRKYWAGTEALKFDLTFQFATFNDAKSNVYDPMVALLSLLYPRIGSGDTASGLLGTFFIPGPNLLYEPTKGSSAKGFVANGDNVSITLGQFLHFNGCYVTKFSADVANSFSIDGWPNCIEATLSFETMDVSFVNNNGSFMEEGLKDASVQVSDFLKSIQQLAKSGGELATKVVKSVDAQAGKAVLGFFGLLNKGS